MLKFAVHTSLTLTFDLCRELYKGMSVSMILDDSSESLDSEDTEQMKVSRTVVESDVEIITTNRDVLVYPTHTLHLCCRQSFVS